MDSSDVVVVGSFNTDLTVFTDVLPSAGETVIGSNFMMGYGGKGANQAVAAKFLGADVRLIAKVGSDLFGERFLEYLALIGINKDGVTKATDTSTGVALIAVQKGVGENQIIVAPGANFSLSKSDLEEADATGLLRSHVLLCQFEIRADTTLRALELAKKNGAITILNPAPVPQPHDDITCLIRSMLEHCDYCCPNEVEAMALISHCDSDLTVQTTEDNEVEELPKSVVKCLRCLAQSGVKIPVVTLGSRGVAVWIDDSQVPVEPPPDVTIYRCFGTNSVLRLAAPHITKVVDSTGAGDCFVGALAYFVSRHPNLSPVEHLRRAVWVASQSVAVAGTQSSYPKHRTLPPNLFKNGTFVWPR